MSHVPQTIFIIKIGAEFQKIRKTKEPFSMSPTEGETHLVPHSNITKDIYESHALNLKFLPINVYCSYLT